MNNKFLNLVGLCMRAGRMVTGEDACIKAIRAGNAKLAIVDGSASDNAKKMLADACAFRSVPMLETGAGELGRAVGKENRKSVVVTDAGFAAAMAKAAAQGE